MRPDFARITPDFLDVTTWVGRCTLVRRLEPDKNPNPS